MLEKIVGKLSKGVQGIKNGFDNWFDTKLEFAIDNARFLREYERMRRFFNSEQGPETLVDFYIKAETAKLTEPAGLLDPTLDEFNFFDVPEKHRKLYNAVVETKGCTS